MKFGALENVDSVDFSLPTNDPTNRYFLAGIKEEPPLKMYIGGPSWGEKSLVGKLYPAGTKPAQFLSYYAQQFNAIEVNATRYAMPQPQVMDDWKEATPPGFTFSLKLPMSISNRRNLMADEVLRNLDDFIHTAHRLGDRLGMSFLQLPAYFKYNRLNELGDFLQRIPSDFPLAIELRNEQWFTDELVKNDLTHLLRLLQRPWIMTDVAGKREVLHQTVTATSIFIRFNGNGLHPTDYTRMDEWISRIELWMQQGINEVYWYIHQPAPNKFYIIDSIAYVAAHFNLKYGLKLPIPKYVS